MFKNKNNPFWQISIWYYRRVGLIMVRPRSRTDFLPGLMSSEAIKCSECEKSYIVQTSRSFREKFQEHLQTRRSGNRTTMKSNFTVI